MKFLPMFLTAALLGAAPSTEEIRRILADRVDSRKQATGIVVGIADGSGRRIVAHGLTAKDGKPAGGDTLFEIGSITKVFTAQILTGTVERGEMKLDDPVSKYLPASVKMPEKGRAITLHDLATHRSGLPRLPSNLTTADISNPYAAYTVANLYEFLSSHTLRREPGAEFEYSNLGVGLLGHVLALHAKTDYETLVRERITAPLGMKSTVITLTPELKPRMAQGHNAKLEPTPNWDLPTLAGAGALRSSANDMLAWVESHAKAGGKPGLGWMIAPNGAAHHGGGTGGFQSFAGFDPKSKTCVVVLSNAQSLGGVDDIGQHLLDPSKPLTPPKKERIEVSFDPKKFDAFVGHYQLAPKFFLSVTREGGRFFTQATAQPKIEVFAMGERTFFPKVIDAELEFTINEASGRANKITLRQNGGVISGPRVDALPAATERKAIALDPKSLDAFVGKYALAPSFHITVTREEGRLFAQATGQGKAEIFPEAPAKFFYRVVDAQITFAPGTDGRAEKLTLHQSGMNMEGKRVE